jgi:hypothetical protein
MRIESPPAFRSNGSRYVPRIDQAVNVVLDDALLEFGTDQDAVIVLRSTTLAANTTLTGVLIGTPVTSALAANSLIIANVTSNGDILIAANRGGNSEEYIFIDASAGTLRLVAPLGDITIDPAASLNITLTDDDQDSLDFSNSAVQWYRIDTRNTISTVVAHSFDTEDAVIVDGAGASYGLFRFEGYTLTLQGQTQVTTQSNNVEISQMTINQSGGAVTVDSAATLRIAGAPIAGSSVTITTPFSFDVAAGLSHFGGSIFVDEISNANMTLGLTINQGANDDDVIGLKSSDVGHAMTGIREADTFGAFAKVQPGGGLHIRGLKDGDELAGLALILEGDLGEAADTTDTTGSHAVIALRAGVTDAGTSVTNVAATGNLFYVGNQATVRLLIKGNGDMHATNITAGGGDMNAVVLDAEDDVGLLRTMQRYQHDDVGVIMTKWDETIKANEEDLRRVGVLTGDFYSLQRMDTLLGGAVWQLHTRLQETLERLTATESKLLALEEA